MFTIDHDWSTTYHTACNVIIHLHHNRHIVAEYDLVKLHIYLLILWLLKHIIEISHMLLWTSRLNKLLAHRVNNRSIQTRQHRKSLSYHRPFLCIYLSLLINRLQISLHDIRKLVIKLLLGLLHAILKFLLLCYIRDKIFHCICILRSLGYGALRLNPDNFTSVINNSELFFIIPVIALFTLAKTLLLSFGCI